MSNLVVVGKTNILGIDVPVITGGFGEGQRVILSKDIANIHNVDTPDINKLINRNLVRFNENDVIDLKNCQSLNDQQLLELGFTSMQISKANNIYLLSERGYTKLVSMMDNSNDKKWEVMDRLIDEYFTMRAVINSEEQLKANLLLSIYNGGQGGIVASKQLSEIETKEAIKPLEEKIQIDAPKVEAYNEFIDRDRTFSFNEASKIIGLKQTVMVKYLQDVGLITKFYKPSSLAVSKGVAISKVTDWDLQTRITSKGIDYISKNYKNYVEKNKRSKKKTKKK